MEFFSEDGGIAGKAALPQVVADDDGVGSAEVELIAGEVAAERRRDVEGFEEARGDEGHGEFFREGAGDFGEVVGVVAADGGEGGVHAVPVFEAHGGDEGVGVAIAGVVLTDLDELVAVGVGERAENDGVDGGEDSAVGSDTEGEGENDGGGKRGRAAKEAQGGAEIEAEGFERAGRCGLRGLAA